jgi:hypothetical protein
VNRLIEWLGKVPTTQARVVVTILCVVATTVRYIIGGWVPNLDWLGFLAVMSGLDVTQYYAKRATEFTPPTPAP